MDSVNIMTNTINTMGLENGGHRRLPSFDGGDLALHEGKGSLNHCDQDARSDTKPYGEYQFEEGKIANYYSAETKGETISRTERKVLDVSKTAERVRAASSAADVSLHNGSKEHKINLKPLKQHASDKVEEHPHSPLSSKPQRLGTTPSYNFSFKCDERAEKRKEFFSKLEEKIHAKEVEKSTLQAKRKETQEAQIKLLRKSLTFKATPMPTFYQEPAPPKVELKKIPPTRAKSPKFGRQKSSSEKEKAADMEANGGRTGRSTRLSLDVRVSASVPPKDPSLLSKRTQRRSLPRLPSDKTAPTNHREIPPPDQQAVNEKSDQPIRTEVKPIKPAGEEKPIDQEPVSEPVEPIDIEGNPRETEPPISEAV